MAFTIADSCVPLINNNVIKNNTNNAGALIIPWCSTPAESVKLSNGEWHHS